MANVQHRWPRLSMRRPSAEVADAAVVVLAFTLLLVMLVSTVIPDGPGGDPVTTPATLGFLVMLLVGWIRYSRD